MRMNIKILLCCIENCCVKAAPCGIWLVGGLKKHRMKIYLQQNHSISKNISLFLIRMIWRPVVGYIIEAACGTRAAKYRSGAGMCSRSLQRC